MILEEKTNIKKTTAHYTMIHTDIGYICTTSLFSQILLSALNQNNNDHFADVFTCHMIYDMICIIEYGVIFREQSQSNVQCLVKCQEKACGCFCPHPWHQSLEIYNPTIAQFCTIEPVISFIIKQISIPDKKKFRNKNQIFIQQSEAVNFHPSKTSAYTFIYV